MKYAILTDRRYSSYSVISKVSEGLWEVIVPDAGKDIDIASNIVQTLNDAWDKALEETSAISSVPPEVPPRLPDEMYHQRYSWKGSKH